MSMQSGLLEKGHVGPAVRGGGMLKRMCSKPCLRGIVRLITGFVLLGSVAALFWPHVSYVTCAAASFLFFVSPFAMFGVLLLIG